MVMLVVVVVVAVVLLFLILMLLFPCFRWTETEKICGTPNHTSKHQMSGGMTEERLACNLMIHCAGIACSTFAGATEYLFRRTMWRRNVASSTNLVAPPKMTEMWRQTMWRQAQMWWQSEMWRQTMRRQNVASGTNVVAVRNVASKCGVRHSLCQTVFQEMCLQKRYSVAGTKVLH